MGIEEARASQTQILWAAGVTQGTLQLVVECCGRWLQKKLLDPEWVEISRASQLSIDLSPDWLRNLKGRGFVLRDANMRPAQGAGATVLE